MKIKEECFQQGRLNSLYAKIILAPDMPEKKHYFCEIVHFAKT